MTVSVASNGIVGEPKHLLLPDTDPHVVFTADDKIVQEVIGVILANAHGSGVLVKVWRNDGTSDHLVFVGTISAGETVNAIEVPLRVYSRSGTQTIKAQAGTASVVTATVVATDRSPAQVRNDPIGLPNRG